MKFGDEVVRFYGLEKIKSARIYYPGPCISRYSDSYELELDKLIGQVRQRLGTQALVDKIAVTLNPDIAAQRQDIGVVVDDFLNLNVDGLLFLPRPYMWALQLSEAGYSALATRRSDMLNELMMYLLKKSSLGVIAFNLEADLDNAHITNLFEFLTTNTGFEAEHVLSPSWESKSHLLIRLSNDFS